MGIFDFLQGQEEHRLDRQGPPAHHHRAGAQHARRARLPAAAAARTARSDPQVRQRRRRRGQGRPGQGRRPRRARHLGGAARTRGRGIAPGSGASRDSSMSEAQSRLTSLPHRADVLLRDIGFADVAALLARYGLRLRAGRRRRADPRQLLGRARSRHRSATTVLRARRHAGAFAAARSRAPDRAAARAPRRACIPTPRDSIAEEDAVLRAAVAARRRAARRRARSACSPTWTPGATPSGSARPAPTSSRMPTTRGVAARARPGRRGPPAGARDSAGARTGLRLLRGRALACRFPHASRCRRIPMKVRTPDAFAASCPRSPSSPALVSVRLQAHAVADRPAGVRRDARRRLRTKPPTSSSRASTRNTATSYAELSAAQWLVVDLHQRRQRAARGQGQRALADAAQRLDRAGAQVRRPADVAGDRARRSRC